MDGLRRRQRAARVRRASIGASPGGIRRAGAGLSRSGRARLRPPAAALRRADRRHEIPATFAFSPEEGTATLPLETRPAASPVPDCEWQRRLGDLTFELDGTPSTRTLAAYVARWRRRRAAWQPADEAALRQWLPPARWPAEAALLSAAARALGSDPLPLLRS